MLWNDISVWKKSMVATSICLVGCSVGVMGVMLYLVNYPWMQVLAVSFFCGLVTCMAFMIAWDMLLHHMKFKDAFRMSYRMSIVSLSIMIIAENVAMLLMSEKSSGHQMHMNSSHNLPSMAIAMGAGFLLSLPYNYYIAQKHNASCH